MPLPAVPRDLSPLLTPRLRSAVFTLLLLFALVGNCAGGSTPAALPADALRVLKAECLSCHNDEKKKGGLTFTSRAALLRGGDDGPVVTPRDPESSRLLQALREDADPHMPPKKQLPPQDIGLLRDWIRAGAAWDNAVFAEESPIVPVELGVLPDSYQPVLALALSSDGKRLAVGRGGQIVVHGVGQTNFPVLASWPAHRDAVQSLAWSIDGRWLISGAFRSLLFWDGTTFARRAESSGGFAGRLTAIQAAPDGASIAVADSVACRDGFVRLVSVADGRVLGSWRAHGDTIFDLDFSRDGKQLVTAGGDRLIKVWEVAARKETARLEGHTAQVLAVAFNTNATQVVSGGADKQLKVWDIATREKIISLGQHAGAISAVAWPGEENKVVALSEAGALLTYSNLKAHTGEQSSASGDERRVGDAGQAAASLATTTDAKTFWAGNQDGLLQAWNAQGQSLGKWEPAPSLSRGPAPSLSRGSESNALPSASAGSVSLLSSASPSQPSRTNRPSVANQAGRQARGLPGKTGRVSLPLQDLQDWGRVVSLSVEPAVIRLSAQVPELEFRISARMQDDFEIDVTSAARFSSSRPAPFAIVAPGRIRALEPGQGVLTAYYGGKRLAIALTVEEADTLGPSGSGPGPISFVRDVLPALSRAGCSAGACHAKPEGQNGFKLSVFSYDPKADYDEIVKEARGRRVFPAAPDESLLLSKPLTRVPHEGGQRFEPGSETHQLLERWMREGLVFALTNEPVLEGITVFPKERRHHKGATQALLVRAHYKDGSTRDVTRLASYAENDKEIAKVDENGLVRIGTLTGQGVVVARYMGFVADAQILVPAERLLEEDRYEA